MSYITRDTHEIDGATLVKLIQRARDREEKRKGLLKGQCIENTNRKLDWLDWCGRVLKHLSDTFDSKYKR